MKKSSLFIIIVILLTIESAFAGTLAKMTVTEVPDGEGVSYIIRNPEESILVLHSNIPEMTFEGNMGIIRVDTPDPGEFRLHLHPGSNIVTFKAEGYMPVKQHIYIPKKEYKEYRVNGETILEELPVVIRVLPAVALVTIDGQPVNITSSIVLPVGDHSISISCIGYENVTEMISVCKANILFEYVLKKTQVSVVKVRTEPVGATVRIDGVKLSGVTPVDDFYDSGTYPISVSLDKYLTVNDTIYIKPGDSENTFTYTLEPNFGLLTIKTNPGAKVYLNDELNLQYTNLKLSPQTVKLHVEKAGCAARDSSLIIRKGSNERVDLYLDEATGTIAVLTTPSNAKIELRGSDGEYFQSTESKIFSDIPTGTYDLCVSSRGYRTDQKKIYLNDDETIQESITLDELRNIPPASKKDGRIDYSRNLGTIGLGYRNEYDRNYYNLRLSYFGSNSNMEAKYYNSHKDIGLEFDQISEGIILLYEIAAKPNFNITRGFNFFAEFGYGIGLRFNFTHYDTETNEVFFWNSGLVAAAGFKCRMDHQDIVASIRYRQADYQWLRDDTGYYEEYMPRYYQEQVDIFVGAKTFFSENVGIGFQMTNWGEVRYEYWDHIWQGWHDAWEYSIMITIQ